MSSPYRSHVANLIALAALAACSSSKPSPAPVPDGTPSAAAGSAGTVTATTPDSVAQVLRGAAPRAESARRDRAVLTREEIRATQFTNMFEVIRALRGNWVRERTAESFGKSSVVQVYLDMQRLSGGAAELRQIAPVNVASVRFLDPIQASARWGMDHNAGAILITTAKP